MGLSSLWPLKRKQPQGNGGPIVTGRGLGSVPIGDSWIIQVEHGVLRVVSLLLSLASAYAVSRVFYPHTNNLIDLAVCFIIAGSFGMLGYFLSRGIAYRMMQKESVWGYVAACLVVIFVEVFCNYVIGVSELPFKEWLKHIPPEQLPFILPCAYAVVSIIPVTGLCLAALDMDLELRKHQAKASGHAGQPVGGGGKSRGQQQQPPLKWDDAAKVGNGAFGTTTYQAGYGPAVGNQWQQHQAPQAQGGNNNGTPLGVTRN